MSVRVYNRRCVVFCLSSVTGFGVQGEKQGLAFYPSRTALSCQPGFLQELQSSGDKPVTEYVLVCTAQTIYRSGRGVGCGAFEGKRKSLKKNAVG